MSTVGRTDPLTVPQPTLSTAELERIVSDEFGKSGSLTELASERDRNFRLDDGRGGSLLVKVQNPADDVGVVEMQSQALLHVAAYDPELPVMRVVPAIDGSLWKSVVIPDGATSFVRLFTFLKGHAAVAAKLDESALADWGSTVARLGRALRGFFHPAAGRPLLWDIKHTSRLRELLSYVRDSETRRLAEQVISRFDSNVASRFGSLRAQVIHNDMGPDNVLVDDAGCITGITDFGDMAHTALACDLAVALADVLGGEPDALERAQPMIRGYQRITPLDASEGELLGDLVAARATTAIIISAWLSHLHPDNIEYISSYAEGASQLVRLIEGVGFDRAAARLRMFCLGGDVPYRSMPSHTLLARRKNILGDALLSYDKPLHLVSAGGVWMFDPDGRRYLDAYNNVPVVGHNHPHVVEAVAAQLHRLNTNTRYLHEAVVELGERLFATMPAGLNRVLFVNSGSEANDVAWQIARGVSGRRGAVVTDYAYHGITEAITDLSPEERRGAEEPSHVVTIPAPDGYRGPYRADTTGWVERYAEHVAESASELARRGTPLAAFLVDTAYISDGVFTPPPHYLQLAAAAVRDAGGLVIADEVQGGHGRTGEHLWSFMASGVVPDIVTMGKPMGNGFPVAAVVARAGLVDAFLERTGFFSTFGGNPVAATAALAVLDIIENEGLIAMAKTVGSYLQARLRDQMQKHELVGDVRGRGLLIGVELVTDRSTRQPAAAKANAVVNAMRDMGVLIGTCGRHGNVLKIRPPLVFETEHADLLVQTLDRALSAAR